MINGLLTNALLLADGTPAASGQGLWTMVPMILMLVAMFVLMSSSQRKKQKQHEAMLQTVKTGDRVTTSSGIIGVVVGVKDKSLSIRSADTKLEILKSAVSEITERAGEAAASQS
jgi:preprotein translocase subunit YajC